MPAPMMRKSNSAMGPDTPAVDRGSLAYRFRGGIATAGWKEIPLWQGCRTGPRSVADCGRISFGEGDTGPMRSIERRLIAMAFALLGGVALLTSPARSDGFRLYSHDIKDGQIGQDQVQSS